MCVFPGRFPGGKNPQAQKNKKITENS